MTIAHELTKRVVAKAARQRWLCPKCGSRFFQMRPAGQAACTECAAMWVIDA